MQWLFTHLFTLPIRALDMVVRDGRSGGLERMIGAHEMSRYSATIPTNRWHGDQSTAGKCLALCLCSRQGAPIEAHEAHEAHGVRLWAGCGIGRDSNESRVTLE